MRNVIFLLFLTSAFLAHFAFAHRANDRLDICDDSLEIANVLLAAANQIVDTDAVSNLMINKIEKGFVMDRDIYLLSGENGVLKIIRTRDYRENKLYYLYEAHFQNQRANILTAEEQADLRWGDMCNTSTEMADIIIGAIKQLATFANIRDLFATRGERHFSPNVTIYRLFGMEFIGGHAPIGGFTLTITKTDQPAPRGDLFIFDVDYQGIRNDENLPLRPPVLVRS